MNYKFGEYIKKKESDFLKTKVNGSDLIRISDANNYYNSYKKQFSLSGVSKSLNEFLPLRLKKGQKVVVTKNKTSHCYKLGDVLRIIKPHYRNKDAWYCKKGWFGTRQVLTDQEFYVC